jgi:hypothetical protein
VIPFLGAPENAVFLKVNRSKDQGIQVEKIDIEPCIKVYPFMHKPCSYNW